MRFDVLFFMLLFVFCLGFAVGLVTADQISEARARIAPAPTAVVPDTAQDYIRQYVCFHAIVTGDALRSKGCV